MDIKINDVSSSDKEIEVTLKPEEFEKEIKAEVLKKAKDISMPGFRKGKVPLNIIKKTYGDALEYEASEKVANVKFWEIVQEKKINPIGQPALIDIKFTPGSDLFFKVKYEVMPVLDVKEYTDNDIEIPDFVASDEEIQKEIDYLLKTNSTKLPVEIVGDDNQYILNAILTRLNDDGTPVEGVKPEELSIDLTNEGIHPDIIRNSKGKKKGESFKFSFEDKHTHKSEDGKEETHTTVYNYNVEIKDIQKIELPELNEELIKKVTKDKLSDEKSLREEIKNNIQSYYDKQQDDILKNKLINTIIKNNDFSAPASLVNNVLEDLIKQEEEEFKRNKYGKYDKTEARNRLRKSAEFEVKWFLIKNEIIKKENLSASEEDLKVLAEKDAEKTGISVDKLLNYYKNSNYSAKILDDKLFDFLKEKNNIKKVAPEKLLKTENEEGNDETK